ncbi:MAG: type II toxin-antitoxin system HicB family antitoxin [Thermoproteota archaeon]|jgi:predicted RNase H-like HicB family nuclease
MVCLLKLSRKEGSSVLLEKQEESEFVAFSSSYPKTASQGKTEENTKDLKETIQVLKEYLEQKKNAKVKIVRNIKNHFWAGVSEKRIQKGFTS